MNERRHRESKGVSKSHVLDLLLKGVAGAKSPGGEGLRLKSVVTSFLILLAESNIWIKATVPTDEFLNEGELTGPAFLPAPTQHLTPHPA